MMDGDDWQFRVEAEMVISFVCASGLFVATGGTVVVMSPIYASAR